MTPNASLATCSDRAWLEDDEAMATGPGCGEPATHYSCNNYGPNPTGLNACKKHKCRCAQPSATHTPSVADLVRQGDPCECEEAAEGWHKLDCPRAPVEKTPSSQPAHEPDLRDEFIKEVRRFLARTTTELISLDRAASQNWTHERRGVWSEVHQELVRMLRLLPEGPYAASLSFIYCNQDHRNVRWYYQESVGFRERLPGSSSSFSSDKERAYLFDTKEEAWAHCRERRRRGHWGRRGKWIVIKLATLAPGVAPGNAPKGDGT